MELGMGDPIIFFAAVCASLILTFLIVSLSLRAFTVQRRAKARIDRYKRPVPKLLLASPNLSCPYLTSTQWTWILNVRCAGQSQPRLIELPNKQFAIGVVMK